MKLIDGKKIADEVVKGLQAQVDSMFRVPGLAIILVGDDPASHTYVSKKEETAKKIGIYFEKWLYPENVSEDEVLKKIDELNKRDEIHGIVIQLPLPKHLSTDRLISALAPEKDVDGFHPQNVQAYADGEDQMVPSLVRGILRLIESTAFDFTGRTAIVIANSFTFVQPLEIGLKRRGMTVESCLPPFDKCKEQTQQADMVVVAIGKPSFVTAEMVKPGAVVIDVGFTRQADGQVIGDADAKSLAAVDGWLTPVPGGVGPMSVAMLLANTIEACQRQTA